MAKDKLLFIKLLLYKTDPKYDRFHIFSELSFLYSCTFTIKLLNKNDFDLGLEVMEAIFDLERKYKNTARQLIQCANAFKNHLKV